MRGARGAGGACRGCPWPCPSQPRRPSRSQWRFPVRCSRRAVEPRVRGQDPGDLTLLPGLGAIVEFIPRGRQ
eukprot:3186387-Alexandrium_andersonii.AAC.1